ncbi:MAG: hypothetical protein CR984_02815 [Proteobacteria bacterium]|nr:MAG: hypothetical protein CR984_02815 [Pseudomonadota bacterium]
MLSGGQKQRVALARTLLNDAPIMIFDDPISQVDMHTAARIVETFRNLAGSRTLVIASHRLSAVRHADHIVVMDSGRIRSSGTHEDLMNAGGYYAKAYRLQEREHAV